MWPRIVEFMLGCWLAVSPFIFAHPAHQASLWWNDMSAGFLIMALALSTYWPPLRRVHLLIFVVGLWLIGFGYFSVPYPAPPAQQNDIVVGLLLLMFSVIPRRTNLPPKPWRDQLFENPKGSGDETFTGHRRS